MEQAAQVPLLELFLEGGLVQRPFLLKYLADTLNRPFCTLALSEISATRMLRAGKTGRLINTASGQARQGFVYTPHYAASKFGVLGITQSLAKELAPTGMTVNAFCPGIITTDMWSYNDEAWGKLLGDYKPGELTADWVNNIPMKRAGTDVAGLLAFLASDDAAYITARRSMSTAACSCLEVT